MPKNPQASSEKPDEPVKAPSTPAANLAGDLLASKPKAPEAKFVKKEESSWSSNLSSLTSGMADAALGTLAIVTRHQSTADIVAGKKSNSQGVVGNIAANVKDIVSNPVATAKALKDETVKAAAVIDHGSTKERYHLAGAAIFTVFTAGFGGSSTAGKVGARTEAIVGAESAMARTVAARSLVSDVRTVLTRSSTPELNDVAVLSGRRVPEGLVVRAAESTAIKPVTTFGQSMANKIDWLSTNNPLKGLSTKFELPFATPSPSRSFAGVEVKPAGGVIKAIDDAVVPAADIKLGANVKIDTKVVPDAPVVAKPVHLDGKTPPVEPVITRPVGESKIGDAASTPKVITGETVKDAVVPVKDPVVPVKDPVVPVKDPVVPVKDAVVPVKDAVLPNKEVPVLPSKEVPVVKPVTGETAVTRSEVVLESGAKPNIAKAETTIKAPDFDAPVIKDIKVVEAQATNLGQQTTKLVDAIADSRVANTGELTSSVRKIDEILERGVTTPSAVKELDVAVKQLDSPQYAAYFAENPKAAAALQEVKTTTGAIKNAAGGDDLLNALTPNLGTARSQVQLVEAQTANLGQQTTKLVDAIADSRVANTGELTSSVRKIDEILERGVTTPSAVRELDLAVKQLDSPQFAAHFAQNPKAAAALQEIKTTTGAINAAGGELLESVAPKLTTAKSPFQLQEPLTAKMPATNVVAEQGLAKVESFSAKLTESGLKLDGDAAASLNALQSNFKLIAEKGATPQLVDDLGKAMRSVEQNVGKDVLESVAGKELVEMRRSVNTVTTSAVERTSLKQIESSLKILDNEAATLSGRTRDLTRMLDESVGARGANNGAVVDRLNSNLKKIDDVLDNRSPVTPSSSGASNASVQAREVQQLIKEFDKPEFSRFFAENPKAAALVEEMKVSSATMGNAASKIETSALAIERIETIGRFGQQTTAAVGKVERIAQSGHPELQLPKVTQELSSISKELITLKEGVNTNQVLSSVRNRIDNLEAGGAKNIAQDLRASVVELENGSAALGRVQKMEATVGTIERETTKIGLQTEKLSANLADNTAAHAQKSSSSIQAQVSDNLDFISRQSKTLTNAVDDVHTVARIKDSLVKIDELGGQALFKGEKAAIYQELKQSVAKLDRAAVEAQGLRSFEANTAAITKEANHVAGLSTRVAENSTLRADANVSQRLVNIEKAAVEVKTASTFEQQSVALKKLAAEIEQPGFQSAMNRSLEGKRVLDDLKASVSNLKQNLEVRALEQSTLKIEAQAQSLVKTGQVLESTVAKDVALSNNVTLRQAVTDYTRAAENVMVRGDRSVAIKQMDQQLAIIEREIAASKVVGSQTAREVGQLKQAHNAIGETVSDARVLAQSVFEKRLPNVENLFNQVSHSSSSVVQRELIRQTSTELQTLRYLESHTGMQVANKLEQAQAKLVVAANELEVAAYRSNLVKLAAEGNKVASDKLLLAGLTSEGFKTVSLAGNSAASKFVDFLAVRSQMLPLIGGNGQTGAMMRNLSANDIIFANNRSMFFNPNFIRTVSGTGMAAGLATIFVSNRMEDDRPIQNFAPDLDQSLTATPEVKAVENTQNGSDVKAGAVIETKAGTIGGDRPIVNPDTNLDKTEIKVKPVSAQAVPARENVTFTANGQTVVRNAFAAGRQNRVVPQDNGVASRSVGQDNFYKMSDVGAFGLNVNDPDYNQKRALISMYGSEHFRGKGAETPADTTTISFIAAQNLIRSTRRSDVDKGFEKPASDRFNMPSAFSLKLNTPVSLMNSNAATRRDTATVASSMANIVGGGTVGNRTTSDTKQMFSSLAASANEGGVGRGTVGEGEEQTEADILEQGGSSVVANQSNHDDDDDNESPAAVSPIAAANNNAAVASNSNSADPDQLSRTVMPGPPRKRNQKLNQAV